MIISLISPLKNYDFSDPLKISAIENILKSHGESKHIVLSSRALLDSIIANEKYFGVNTRTYAINARKFLSDTINILNSVSYYIEINIDDKDLKEKVVFIDGGSKAKLTIGYDKFVDSSATQSTTILCEDIDDVSFYEKIGKFYAEKEKLSSMGMSYNPVNGGGANTKKNFDAISDRGNICLCIVDNDKKHPKSPLGGTCRPFKDIKYQNKSRVIILDVHEVESLLPDFLIGDVLSSEHYRPQVIDSFDRLQEIININPEAKFFFDYKKGITLKEAYSLDTSLGEYWVPLLSSLKQVRDSRCFKQKVCNCKDSCFYIDGFGDNILHKVVAKINKHRVSSLEKRIDPLTLKHWREIGREFFSWTCSPMMKSRL